jgi:hypothetical protein
VLERVGARGDGDGGVGEQRIADVALAGELEAVDAGAEAEHGAQGGLPGPSRPDAEGDGDDGGERRDDEDPGGGGDSPRETSRRPGAASRRAGGDRARASP